MRFFKQLIDFYINYSIHVAFGVFCLFQITKLDLLVSTDYSIDYFVFFGTILSYNALKYYAPFKNHIFTLQHNYLLVVVSLLAFFVAMYFYIQLSPNFKWTFVKIGFVVLLYPLLRKFGLFKMIVVSFCVTYITAYIPMVNHIIEYCYLLSRFIVVICLLLPLEIIDLNKDAETIYTIPQKIGIQNTKILGYCLLLIFCLLNPDITSFFIALSIAISIFFVTEKRAKYYTSFWVESIPILWWIFIWIYKFS